MNNDGTVGIQDFLQVLGDWGPCPSASVVGIGSRGPALPIRGWAIRVWSDGRIEGLMSYDEPALCEKVVGSDPHDTWFDFGTTLNSIRPVTAAIREDGVVIVALEDGTVWTRRFDSVDSDQGPPREPCGLFWEIDWIEIGATP